MRQRGGFGGLLGAPGGGGPMQILACMVAGLRLGVILHWRLHATHELALRSTGASCICLHAPSVHFLLAGLTQPPCARVRHAWAAWRRPGGSGLSAEGPLGAWFLRDLCLQILADPGFSPVLGRRGWTSATLEWAAGRLLDLQGWPERRLCTSSILAWRLRRPSRLEPIVCAGGGGGHGQWGGAAC